MTGIPRFLRLLLRSLIKECRKISFLMATDKIAIKQAAQLKYAQGKATNEQLGQFPLPITELIS